ncbi:prolipoprotein diacylglyceryl transferase [Aerococcus urinaehominis]|uniref:Phosphatidylglycerol--prolipoprotein diacylglyceryl transferase n=2 Tax=Aerococcus urinaehominis TaxID=128944 RepID=A0A0X8FMI6_9LACT|nr:prolipoprotein diacylglyceryl transferase [Aerococcus urinaehominis]
MLTSMTINPVAFDIFGWPIYWYGLIIGLGMFIGISLGCREFKSKRFNEDFILNMLMWAIPIGFIGARLYYVIFEWDYYRHNLSEIVQIWNGGIAIYGGIIAAVLTIYWYCRRQGILFLFILDVMAPYLLLVQAIGRWGNFVNQEAHGGPVSVAFLRETLHLPEFIVQGMYIDGTYYHPTFLYESIWNFVGFAVLSYLRSKPHLLKEGATTALYCIWYGCGRFFIEGMRTDSLMLGPVRVSQILSLILVLAGIIGFIYLQRDKYRIYYSEIRGF